MGRTVIKLPKPISDSKVSVEAALLVRKSIRSYQKVDLTLAEVSQLLWAAQGINRNNGMRTAPSAGALYPLEVYLVVGQIEQLPVGIYKYRIKGHELVQISDEEKRQALAAAGYGQSCIERASINIVIAAVYERTAGKYGERAVRYVHMEVGHAAQNIYLQAIALELGTVVVGAFDDSRVKKILVMDTDEAPLYIMPVGRARK
jgi:SagB-type dehydrogenase family enzyme